MGASLHHFSNDLDLNPCLSICFQENLNTQTVLSATLIWVWGGGGDVAEEPQEKCLSLIQPMENSGRHTVHFSGGVHRPGNGDIDSAPNAGFPSSFHSSHSSFLLSGIDLK